MELALADPTDPIHDDGLTTTGLGVQPPVPSLFPEQTQLRLCSANVCTNGHEWVPTVALAKCGYGTPQGWNGCGAPILAVKVDACPVCNEPVAQMRFRTDHTPPTPFVSPLCIPGSVTQADVAQIVLTRNHHTVEEAYDKKFPPIEVPAQMPLFQKEEGN